MFNIMFTVLTLVALYILIVLAIGAIAMTLIEAFFGKDPFDKKRGILACYIIIILSVFVLIKVMPWLYGILILL